MNLKEFAQEFIDSIKEAVEMDEKDYDLELTSAILEYITDSGEINAPEYCYFQKTRSRITAYDYNDEAESLDLFYLIKADTLLGKVNNNKVEKGFNFLASFYREAIDGTLLQSPNITVSDEISEIVSLIQSTIGQISQLRLYIITDGLTDPASIPYPAENEEQNIIIEFNVWDMQRVYQQHNLRIGKEKIEIDFPTSYNTEIQCLKMSEENPYIDAYLAIIPGETLAKIYKRYQQTLLEKTFGHSYNLKEKLIRAFDAPSEKSLICFSLTTMVYLPQPAKLKSKKKEEAYSSPAFTIGRLSTEDKPRHLLQQHSMTRTLICHAYLCL